MTAEERLASRIPVAVSSRTLEVDGRRLRCLTGGSGDPLVLLHGLNIGWGQWYAVFADLARRHTVMALDLPGAGGASRMDLLADDVAGVLLRSVDGALRQIAPQGAAVVGHSLGAWAALKLAAQDHPSVRAVVAVSPVGFTEHVPPRFRPLALRPLARFLATVAVPPTRANIEAFLGDVMKDRAAMAPEYVDYVAAHVAAPPVSHPFLLIHRLFRPFRFRDEFLLSPRELSSIRRPVLIIHGAEDPLIPFVRVRAAFGRVPGARTEVLDGVGHVPPIERPAEFIRLLDAFLT